MSSGSPRCHQPCSQPRNRHASLKLQQTNLFWFQRGRAASSLAPWATDLCLGLPSKGLAPRVGAGSRSSSHLPAQSREGDVSSSRTHLGMAFPQGEEEEEEKDGRMMPGGMRTPQSATCKRRWEASVCRREKQGGKLFAVNLAFLAMCSLPGRAHCTGLGPFSPSLGIASRGRSSLPGRLSCPGGLCTCPGGPGFYKLTSQRQLPQPAASLWQNQFSRFSGGRGNYLIACGF